jgi:glycine cleavage system H protein
MTVPENLRYTSDHEWASSSDARVRIGITDFAQDALGDIVFVQLPEVGKQLAAGEVLGEVESTKSVSEIYAPVVGTVVAINEKLSQSPETLNSDPYGEGWICELEIADLSSLDGLLDAAAYERLTSD